jgi:hypothetical protein
MAEAMKIKYITVIILLLETIQKYAGKAQCLISYSCAEVITGITNAPTINPQHPFGEAE